MDLLPLLTEITAVASAESKETLKRELAQYLNGLLLNDFSSLVQLLYQVDVPEKKVKAALQDNPGEDAGLLLAELLVQRQEEKKITRDSFRFRDDETGEERW